MPVNKDALRRYRIIDKMLSDPNRDYTTEDILAKVNCECDHVSKRMVQKDIKALEEEFGKTMVRNAGRRGTVRYEDQSEPLFYQQLTLEEEELLREVLKSLGQFDGLDSFVWLDLLKKKLEINDGRSSFPAISFSANDVLQLPRTLLGRLFVAITRKKVIRVTYTPFGNTPRKFVLYPYQLKQFNDRWFLLSCIKSQDFPFDPEFIITLALDRMDEHFDYVEDEEYIECAVDLKARFDEIIGVTLLQDNVPEDIYFAVMPASLEYVRSKAIHSTQIELDEESQEFFRMRYPSLEVATFFSIECRENPELFARFASYKENVVIVEPAYIRNKIREMLRRAAANYDSITD